jgi:hypothetical protein
MSSHIMKEYKFKISFLVSILDSLATNQLKCLCNLLYDLCILNIGGKFNKFKFKGCDSSSNI